MLRLQMGLDVQSRPDIGRYMLWRASELCRLLRICPTARGDTHLKSRIARAVSANPSEGEELIAAVLAREVAQGLPRIAAGDVFVST